jgi:hypothetical protein
MIPISLFRRRASIKKWVTDVTFLNLLGVESVRGAVITSAVQHRQAPLLFKAAV